MLLDARAVSADVETDVCVVGAGPAGLTLAREWSGGAFRVALLESGGAGTREARRGRLRGESVGHPYYRLEDARARAFGGASNLWVGWRGWRARPLEPLDLEARPGIPNSGWPFGWNHLRPYYERAQAVCGLVDGGFDTEDWDVSARGRLPLPSDRVHTTVFRFAPSDNFLRHHQRLAKADNVTLFLHATVVNIATDEDPREISHLDVGAGASRFRVRARYYVLAAGGLENPRLLLSSQQTHPRGLGNSRDLVGRFFMERLAARTGILEPGRDDLIDRLGFYQLHKVGDEFMQAALSLHPDVVRREQLLNCAFYVLPRSRPFTLGPVTSLASLRGAVRLRPRPEHLGRHVVTVARGGDKIIAAAYRRLRPSPRSTVLVLRSQAEPWPNPDSRVTLARSRDDLGMRRVRLDWRISERDRHSIRRTQEILDEHCRAAGIGRIEQKLGDEKPPTLFEGNYHHMGTTRMHPDPKQGVVDADCRLHDAHNMYVAGSSVFPTAGYANPTLTLVALAVRLADHIRKRLAT